MKKLLILAYDFPPYVSVGSLRPYSWLKYLKEFEIEPIVVTRQFSAEYGDARDYVAPSESTATVIEETAYGTIIRSPYKPNFANRLFLKYGDSKFRLLRKMYTALFEIAQFFFVCGPKKELYRAADAYLKFNKVDAIIATGDPFVLFSFASKLSKKHGVKWIADYRDLWSHTKKKGCQFERFLYRFQEKRIVKSASEVVTVSDFLKYKLNQYFPNKKFSVFQNGYDPEVIGKNGAIFQNNDALTISFVGTIYDWHPWKSVLSAFSHVCNTSNKKIQLNLYGVNQSEQLNQFIALFPDKVQRNITIYKRLQNEEVFENLMSSNVLLLFNDYSIMGTKIFDYIGSKRKIILCYSNDSEALKLKEHYYNIDEVEGFSQQLQADLIKETNAGVVVEDEDHLHTVLWDLLDEFASTGYIENSTVGTENYSRKIQVRKLAELVRQL